MRTLLMVLVGLCLGAGAAAAQPASGVCANYPTYFGCYPPNAAVSRANTVPTATPAGSRMTTLGEIFSLLEPGDVTTALGYSPYSASNPSNFQTSSQVATSLLAYQPVLGFAPVQQGTGAGQLNNLVKLGWSGTALKAQVDATDLGNLATQSWVEAGYPVSGVVSWLNASPTLNTTYSAGGLTNGVIIGAGGNQISYCPVLSCITSPSADHQRAGSVFWSTTSDDGHSEEQTVAIETVLQTGRYKLWAPSQVWSVGDNIRVSNSNAIYRVTAAGTSAASGSGPSGTGSAITDGTATLAWINASAIDGKVGLYNEAIALPGVGDGWAQANNYQLQPGSLIPGATHYNTEIDFTNNSGTNCVAGVNTCYGLSIYMGGTNYSTAGLAIAQNGILGSGSGPSSIFGVWLSGNIATLSDIEVDGAGSPYGLAFGQFVAGSHTTATIFDQSTGHTGLLMSGTKTSEDISDQSASPAAFVNIGTHSVATMVENSSSPIVFQVSGSHATQVYNDVSTSPAAMNLSGTYSLTAITTQNATTTNALLAHDGQRVCFNSVDGCFVHSGGKLLYLVGGNARFSINDTTGAVISSGGFTTGTP